MKFSTSDALTMFFAFTLLLLGSRILGEISRRFHQPAVLGELLIGILLGPTVLGRFLPEVYQSVFPASGPVVSFFSGFTIFSVSMFLFVAGMEIDFMTVKKLGRTALVVSAAGIIIPFALGGLLGQAFPVHLGFQEGTVSPLIFALFFGTALSISALPVIAKTLMDMGLYKSRVGSVTMAAACVDDLFGWIIFAMILSAINPGNSHHPLHMTLGLTIAFTIFMLTLGRKAVDLAVPILSRSLQWPSGIISFVLILGMMCAAFTEWLGIHSLFGAFIAGVVVGDSQALMDQRSEMEVKHTIEKFITSILAPIVFATAGLRIDFWTHFDLGLVSLVVIIACAGKIGGCYWAAKTTGMNKEEALSVGFAMNARGAMGIILALTALEAEIIGVRLFVALVTMAIVTSAISGPAIKFTLKKSA